MWGGGGLIRKMSSKLGKLSSPLSSTYSCSGMHDQYIDLVPIDPNKQCRFSTGIHAGSNQKFPSL